jgi:hypothetical protein
MRRVTIKAVGRRGGHDAPPARSVLVRVISALLLGGFLASGAAAQVVIDIHERLDFDRPEAWAMKYFASVARLSSMGPPSELGIGELEVALELGWVPTLGEEQRRVGFLGTKPEHLNRSSVFARPRLSAGLPGDLTLSVGYVPPVRVAGIEPHLLALALQRPLWQGRLWRLGGGAALEWGEFRGDITCERAAAAAGEDPQRNPYRCLEPSRDRMELRQGSLELTAARMLPLGVEPYATVSAGYLDSRFRVGARYGSVIDRTLLTTEGVTWAYSAGLAYQPRPRWRLVGELFYAPLAVVRSTGGPTRNDELFNARALVAWRPH